MVVEALYACCSALWVGYFLLLIFLRVQRTVLDAMHARDYRLAVMRQQIEAVQRNDRLAANAHDSVSSAVASICLLAQANEQTADVGDKAQWQMVNSAALKALDGIHQVIEILAGSASGEAMEGKDAVVGVSHADTDGMKHDRASSTTNLAIREAQSLFNELAENCRRYADMSQPTEVESFIRGGNIIIEQHNAVAADCAFRLGSGTGLELHRREIERLGGSLETSLENGQWSVRAAIPLRAVTSTKAGDDND